jgi:2-dehydropantoate 2-reductase
MRIGIVGAGAIGTWLAARLAAAGHEVSVLARGETLAGLRTHGARVRSGEDVLAAPVTASDDPAALGVQELLIVATKSQALPEVAPAVAPMVDDATIVMPATNGVPWWFLAGAPGALDAAPLHSVDPDGACARCWPGDQVLGSVVHASAWVIEPGFVHHVMGDGLIIGAVAPALEDRVPAVAEALGAGGFAVTCSDAIRQDIWFKLWGNMTMNPLSAITGATCDVLLSDSEARGFATTIMNEAAAVGAAIGCPVTDRPKEIAELAGVATPALDQLIGIMRVFERVRGFPPAS